MSYPILYKSNETDFFTMGLGPVEMLKATVTQERNGIFIFEGEILTDSPLFPLVLENYIIKADADHLLKDQRFRIKRIVPNHDGKAQIYAEHVSYLSRELTIKPEVNITGSAQIALSQWKASIVESNPFVVSSDITTSASTKWRIDKVENPMMALGGVEGSILDRWGGEYLFDNYHVSLLKKRGKTATNILAYGRNITDFEQERNILSTYTSIAPYAIYTDDREREVIVTVDGYVVDSEHVNKFPNRVTKPIDFSSEFESDEIPTKSRLTTLAQQYIADNEIGVPTTSIKISFLDLSQTADYADYAFLEQVNLCDDVRVHYPKLGVNTIAKVVRVVWNCLTESYDEIEIGQKRMSLASQIQEQNKVIQEINTQVNQSQVSADGKNMIFYGLYGENGLGEPSATKIGDSWFKPNGLETELYVWTGIEWKLIMSTSSFNEINETIEDLDGELEQTTTTANDAVNKAEQAIRDVGFANSSIEAADGKISSLEQNLEGFQQVVQNTYADKATVTALATQWTQTTDLANGHTSAINSLGDSLNLRVTTDDFKKSMGVTNLITNGGNIQSTAGWYGPVALSKHGFYKDSTANLLYLTTAGTTKITASGEYFNILPSTEYTLKFTGFASENVKDMDVWFLSRKKDSSATYDNSELLITTKLSPGGLDTRTITFTTNDTDDQAYLRFDNNGSTNMGNAGLYIVDIILVKGEAAPDRWFASPSDTIMSQINISPENILIASKKIYIDGETYIANGVIKTAMIEDLAVSGAKIANATIGSAKIINIDASKVTAETLSAITANTGNLNVSGNLTMTTDNTVVKGTYDYKEAVGTAYTPRRFVGSSELGRRYLGYFGEIYSDSNAYLGYAETFFGLDYFKMRWYDTDNARNLQSRIDMLQGNIEFGQNWGQPHTVIGTGGLLTSKYIASRGYQAHPSEDLFVVNNDRDDLADLRVGKDGTGKVLGSFAVYNRTYSQASNLYVTEFGSIGRSVSARKYKLLIEESTLLDKAKNFLQIKPKNWYDKAEVESVAKALNQYEDIEPSAQAVRHHGFIADELDEIGLNEVVQYGIDGQVEGLAYDRLTIYYHELIKDLYNRIEVLENGQTNSDY